MQYILEKEVMKDYRRKASAITSRNGLRVVKQMAENPDEEITPTQLGGILGLRSPTVSQAFGILEVNGLVNVREEGRQRFYTLTKLCLHLVETILAFKEYKENFELEQEKELERF